ncbi:SOS response-associated peptidase family protein [Streptomyces sp. NPDC057027]|uniref:SOS response-associated peptidase family protein n=1 Tax=Streptomyces sp. NPDC057027 TaxID=3346004 RepID=UPI003631E82B
MTPVTIITTEATAAGRICPRKPLALTPGHYDAWLDPHHTDTRVLRAVLAQPTDG